MWTLGFRVGVEGLGSGSRVEPASAALAAAVSLFLLPGFRFRVYSL